MTPEIENLKSVLDMSEKEQERWVKANILSDKSWREKIYTSLADLAFKLRDEAVKRDITKYIDAGNIVQSYVLIKTRKAINWTYDSQPIHWILASLIAAEIARSK